MARLTTPIRVASVAGGLAALLAVAAGCGAGWPALYSEDGSPIVGRLQLRDRTIDLTAAAFGDAPGQVAPGAYAERAEDGSAVPIMADIDHEIATPIADRRPGL